MADVLTLEVKLREKVAWCGDFNNVCKSYAEAARILVSSCGFVAPRSSYLKMKSYKNVKFFFSQEATKDSVVTTDVWISMGDESESAKKKMHLAVIKLMKEY